jgi:hypothetical protein
MILLIINYKSTVQNTYCIPFHGTVFFIFNLTLIVSNYRLICWAIIELKDRELNFKIQIKLVTLTNYSPHTF